VIQNALARLKLLRPKPSLRAEYERRLAEDSQKLVALYHSRRGDPAKLLQLGIMVEAKEREIDAQGGAGIDAA
jgi:hypothetical protein